MSVGQLEEGATGWGDARLVPGERRSTLEARAVDSDNGHRSPVHCRAGNDGEAESFGGQLDERSELAGLGDDAWHEPGVAARVLEQGAQSAAAHEGDHRLLAEHAEGDGAAAAERMAAPDGEHEWFDGDDPGADVRRERLHTEPD